MSSRLQKIEERKSKRQAILFTFLTLLLIIGVIFLGIPSLIKMVIFLENLHSSGQAVETKDSVPPAPPRLQVLSEATNSASLDLKGFAESGATVKIYRDHEEIQEVVADKEGEFIIDNLKLELGENELQAKATDNSGNESKLSALLTISYDNSPPVLTLTNPANEAEFFDEDKEILVAGETDPDANVVVNDFFVLVDTEGNFVKKLELQEGENEILVVATDKAGNATQETLIVRYTP